MSRNMKHFGDPCIHCGVSHEEMQPGPCIGDPSKVIPIAYRKIETRWDGIEHYLVLFSDNHTEHRYGHVSERLPYFHFGYSDDLLMPPRYHDTLKETSHVQD